MTCLECSIVEQLILFWLFYYRLRVIIPWLVLIVEQLLLFWLCFIIVCELLLSSSSFQSSPWLVCSVFDRGMIRVLFWKSIWISGGERESASKKSKNGRTLLWWRRRRGGVESIFFFFFLDAASELLLLLPGCKRDGATGPVRRWGLLVSGVCGLLRIEPGRWNILQQLLFFLQPRGDSEFVPRQKIKNMLIEKTK